MTQSDIVPFRNTTLNCSIRTIERDGEPWFIAKDVCDALDISNVSQAVNYLDSDEKSNIITNDIAQNGGRAPLIINESGLYSLILRSRKPEARQFKKWITAEVLPSLRKHGAYATPQKLEEMLADPDTMIKTLTALKAEQEKRRALETQVAADRPKVLFADAVTASQSSVLIGELAKVLKQNGVDIGAKRLFARLREEGYLCKRGADYNMPTQYAMERGLFEIKKGVYVNSSGANVVTRTVKVTGKGQVYFVNKYLRKQEQPA